MIKCEIVVRGIKCVSLQIIVIAKPGRDFRDRIAFFIRKKEAVQNLWSGYPMKFYVVQDFFVSILEARTPGVMSRHLRVFRVRGIRTDVVIEP